MFKLKPHGRSFACFARLWNAKVLLPDLLCCLPWGLVKMKWWNLVFQWRQQMLYSVVLYEVESCTVFKYINYKMIKLPCHWGQQMEIQACALSLLETSVFHVDVAEAVADAGPDLVDYCVRWDSLSWVEFSKVEKNSWLCFLVNVRRSVCLNASFL